MATFAVGSVSGAESETGSSMFRSGTWIPCGGDEIMRVSFHCVRRLWPLRPDVLPFLVAYGILLGLVGLAWATASLSAPLTDALQDAADLMLARDPSSPLALRLSVLAEDTLPYYLGDLLVSSVLVFGLVLTGFAQLLVWLATQWSVPIHCALAYRPATAADLAIASASASASPGRAQAHAGQHGQHRIWVYVDPQGPRHRPALVPLVLPDPAQAWRFPATAAAGARILRQLQLQGTRPATKAAALGGKPAGSSRSLGVAGSNFAYSHCTYIYDEPSGSFVPLAFPDRPSLAAQRDSRGRAAAYTTAGAQQAERVWSANAFRVPPKTFLGLFVQHAVAPFFVFQLFTMLIWMLDDYLINSIFSMVMLFSFEAAQVVTQLRIYRSLMNMLPPLPRTWTFRDGAWKRLTGAEIVPGDLIALVDPTRVKGPSQGGQSRGNTRKAAPKHPAHVMARQGRRSRPPNAKSKRKIGSAPGSAPAAAAPAQARRPGGRGPLGLLGTRAPTADPSMIPCDLLLLQGQAVVREAMLTGESTPLAKRSLASTLRSLGEDPAQPLDPDRHRASLLMGGTQLVQATGDPSQSTPAKRRSGPKSAAAGPAGPETHLTIVPVPHIPAEDVIYARAIRTGFGTTQGGLMRTLLHAADPAVLGHRDAYTLILLLLAFSLLPAGYALYRGFLDPSRSRYPAAPAGTPGHFERGPVPASHAAQHGHQHGPLAAAAAPNLVHGPAAHCRFRVRRRNLL